MTACHNIPQDKCMFNWSLAHSVKSCWEIQNTLNWNQNLQWQKKTLEGIIPGCWNKKTVFRHKTRLREIRNSTVCKQSHLSWQEILHFESRKKEIWILSVLNKSLDVTGKYCPNSPKNRKRTRGSSNSKHNHVRQFKEMTLFTFVNILVSYISPHLTEYIWWQRLTASNGTKQWKIDTMFWNIFRNTGGEAGRLFKSVV